MSMDTFKEFVKNKPYLKDKVDRKETTWQELYEHYDLYGEDDDLFKESNEKRKATKEDGLSHILDLISDVDINKISEGLSGMKKILNILNEVTMGDNNIKKRGSRKRDDD